MLSCWLQEWGNTDLKGDGCRSGDCKERSDAEIKCTGKRIGKTPSDLRADVKQILTCCNADRSDAEEGESHPGDAEADESGQHCSTCLLPHGRGEDQIARTKDKSEQHGGYEDIFLFSQAAFHQINLSIK